MRINAIQQNSYYPTSQTKINKKNNLKPNFKAMQLSILNEVKNGVKGEAKDRFYRVIGKFKEYLAKQKDYGCVYISDATPNVLIDTKYGKENANLKLSVFGKEANFFYNIQSREEEIVRDLKNTYQYLQEMPRMIYIDRPHVGQNDPIAEMVSIMISHYP